MIITTVRVAHEYKYYLKYKYKYGFRKLFEIQIHSVSIIHKCEYYLVLPSTSSYHYSRTKRASSKPYSPGLERTILVVRSLTLYQLGYDSG